MTYTEISRDEVPPGSFRYGQLASEPDFAVKPHLWAVCTPCAKPKNEADNGASGFDTVLVAHFLSSSEQTAREIAEGLSGEVTLVRPA